MLFITTVMIILQTNCVVEQTSDHPAVSSIQVNITFCIALLQLILGIAGLVVLIRYKKRLNIEKPGHNPLKLIYKVLKYAWKHKFPEFGDRVHFALYIFP